MNSENTPFTQAIGENLFIGLIARVKQPGCKAENMVILEGSQGILKSTALRSLIGDKWFGELLTDLGSKDAIMGLKGKWLVEVPELDAFVRSEPEAIKSALSVQIDSLRVPYGRTIENFPRQCLFVGTTNAAAYLKDQTGGRRFWPLRCGQIEVERIKEDRDQLFAEALALYLGGAKWYTVPKDAAKDEVHLRTEADPWEQIVLEKIAECNDVTEPLTVWRILKMLEMPAAHINRGHQMRVAQILTNNGYTLRKSNGLRIYVKNRAT